jgi:hypothetical protein
MRMTIDFSIAGCRRKLRTQGTHVCQNVLRNEFLADFLHQFHPRNLVLGSFLIGLWVLEVGCGISE